ncbi:MAG: hypothetical protein LUD07_04915 [Clostridiales bacterium]|nr:hypothetical protein [Clostridiales bacterium]
MAQEILSVKLSEFDRLFTRMHDLLQKSESFTPERIRAEILALSEESARKELLLHNSLKRSKAAASGTLLNGFNLVEDTLRQVSNTLEEKFLSDSDEENNLEARLLLSEYVLDFIMLAASRGLIFSLEALEEERSHPAQTL